MNGSKKAKVLLSEGEMLAFAAMVAQNPFATVEAKLERLAALLRSVEVTSDMNAPSEAWARVADLADQLKNGNWHAQLEQFKTLTGSSAGSSPSPQPALFVLDKGDGKGPVFWLGVLKFDARLELAQLKHLRTSMLLDATAERVTGRAGGYSTSLVGCTTLKGAHVLAAMGPTPYAVFTDFLWGCKSDSPASDGGLLMSSWGDDFLDAHGDLTTRVFPKDVAELKRAGVWDRDTLRFMGFVYGSVHDALGHQLPLSMTDKRKSSVGFFLRGGLEETLADLHLLWVATSNLDVCDRAMTGTFSLQEHWAFAKVVMMKRVVGYCCRGLDRDPVQGNAMLDHDQRCGLLHYGALRRGGALVQKNGHLEFVDRVLPDVVNSLLDDCLRVEAKVDSPERYANALAHFNNRHGFFSSNGQWCVPAELRNMYRA